MHHVINALGRSSRRSMRSRAARRQQLLHAITIVVIGLAGLAVLAMATLRSSTDDAPAVIRSVSAPAPQPESLYATTASMQTVERAAAPARPVKTDKPAASESAPAARALLEDVTTREQDADPSAPAVLSLHSLAGGMTDAPPVARAAHSPTVFHAGAQRVVPLNAAGERLFDFENEPSLMSGPLLSADASPAARTSAIRDLFSADLLNRLPADSSVQDLTFPTDELRGLDLPESTPAPLSVDDIEPLTQSSLFNGNAADADGDSIDAANIFGALLDDLAPPAKTTARRPSDAGGTVPEPATMPVLLCAWLLVVRRRRRPGETTPLRELLRDARSFKLPPGSSDLTLDQIDALRRSRIGLAA